MRLSKSLIFQVVFGILFILIITLLINNLSVNLTRAGLGLNFQWLMHPAGFALAESSLPFKPSDNYAWAILIGWTNSLKVIITSLFLATLLGLSAGIARISSNALLRKMSSLYVALIRQIPLLIQLLFWYFVAFLGLSKTPVKVLGDLIMFSNQGVKIFGLELSVEFSALIVGLTVFTGASIAEIVRGGMNSVPKGQWEAFRSLGISDGVGIRNILAPQALPAIIPGLTSQYLNLAKNSTLAIAVGFPDIYAVSDTTITQTGRAIEGFLILLLSFLFLNLVISFSMELINKIVLKANRIK